MRFFSFSIICLVFLLAVQMPLTSQQKRPLDDREIFTRFEASSTQVLPNVMVLADNSNSMQTAIYHPGYDPTIKYADTSKYTLDGMEFFLKNGVDSRVVLADNWGLVSVTNLKICRPTSGPISYSRHAEGTYQQRNGRTWKVTWDPVKSTYRFKAGKTISFYYNGNLRTANIVSLKIDANDDNIYYITVNTDYYPNKNNQKTVWSDWTDTYPSGTHAFFTGESDSCGAYNEFPVSLYGIEEASRAVYYETNYLYWLAFFATPQQISEVREWGLTGGAHYGMMPVPGSDPAVWKKVGFYRIQVERDVLLDVIVDICKYVNLGLSAFDADSAGGDLLEVMGNKNPDSNANDYNNLRNAITALRSRTGTPLAEALATIWAYFKEGGTTNSATQDFSPAKFSSSSCGKAVGGGTGFPGTCPIKYACQHNYVVIMTDGQSSADNFRDTIFGKVSGCVFRGAVKGPTGWGDSDDNDPVNYLQDQKDITDYCENESCWFNKQFSGTDFLDDVAFYIRANDIFPDAEFPDMQGKQNIFTYAIGFAINNEMLAETAKNGEGVYYISNDYDSLKSALKNAILDILTREFAFSSFTAPKKVTTTTSEGYSFVGFFKSRSDDSIWDGFLQGYAIQLRWCPDTIKNGKVDDGECPTKYPTEEDCEANLTDPTVSCIPTIHWGSETSGSEGSPAWRAEEHMPSVRNLYTHIDTTNVFAFNDPGHKADLMTKIGVTSDEYDAIIYKISQPKLADIFHSDIAYVGPPPKGKEYVLTINPPECDMDDPISDPDCFQWYYEAHQNRVKVIYVGTNDGIMHMFRAEDGNELWGFVPDEVLPSLGSIVNDKTYTFTVDGYITTDDIYVRGGANPGWKTIAVFGLKDGGEAFYALDVTSVGNEPTLMWKFKNDSLAKSWGKPVIGKIRYKSGTSMLERYVVVLAGGMAFDNEDINDPKGKAVFVVDAATGELIWRFGYSKTGSDDSTGTKEIDAKKDGPNPGDPGYKFLTKADAFNFPIPSSLTAMDADNNGYLDTIYFGNVAGHMFKTDISNSNMQEWKTYLLYKNTHLTPTPVTTVKTVITDTQLDLNMADGSTLIDKTIIGITSKAMAVVDSVDAAKKSTINITKMSTTSFQNEPIAVAPYDPIFLSPAVAYDGCYNQWVCFGTGDRVRSRTNPAGGRFLAVKDGNIPEQITEITDDPADMFNMSSYWVLNPLLPGTYKLNLPPTTNLRPYKGWWYDFPQKTSAKEKLFDPSPVILPDSLGRPHVYCNTYLPSAGGSNPCKVDVGKMMFYDVTLDVCSNGKVTGTNEVGRIAGGGIFGEPMVYVMYEGTGEPGSIPPPKDIRSATFDKLRGQFIFYREEHK